MTPFPDHYVGNITRVDKLADGAISICFWAKRDESIIEVLHASPDSYLEEFPGNTIEVTPWPYPSKKLPTQ
jgi:hypothetical protein